jgi:thiol-disulfide isomerase/thioredoxin
VNDDSSAQMSEPAAPPRRQPMFLWVIVVAVLVTLLWRATDQRTGHLDRAMKHAGVGRPLPALRLQGLTGSAREVSLADLGGHVVLLNFWGTWCGPCVLEFPHIAEMREHFAKHADFMLLPVSCGTGDDNDLGPLRQQTLAFLSAHDAALPVYADQDATTRKILSQVADMQAYPFTLVLDRQGVIRAVWEGYGEGSEKDMEQLIGQLLATAPKPE